MFNTGQRACSSPALERLASRAAVLSNAGVSEERDTARLFVGGLAYECTDEELKALADQVVFALPPAQCQLLECRVLPKRGCGYLRFASWGAAEEAIHALNERTVSGWPTPLRVRWATPKSTAPSQQVQWPSPDSSQSPPNQGNSSPGLGAGLGDALQLLLSHPAGRAQLATDAAKMQLIAANIANNGSGGTEDKVQAEATVVAQGLDPKRLFVGQISRDLKDKTALIRLFEPYGVIDSVRFLEDKGIAYIQYDEFASAKTALTALDNMSIPGISREQGLQISFSKLR